MTNTFTEITEFIEQLDYTLSYALVKKLEYKYSTRILKLVQLKIFYNFIKNRILKKSTLLTLLIKKYGYSKEYAESLLSDMEISLLYPFIR